MASTSVTLIGYYVIFITDFPVDAVIGIIVSLIIIKSGYEILHEMTGLLVGQAVDEEINQQIIEIFNNNENILNIHDLRIHSYGAETMYGTCDVIVDGNRTVAEIHKIVDYLQEEIREKFNVELTIHIDPQETDIRIIELNRKIKDLMTAYPDCHCTDLHYNDYSHGYIINLYIPYKTTSDSEELISKIKQLSEPVAIDIRVERI